jgi:hypothetical protein
MRRRRRKNKKQKKEVEYKKNVCLIFESYLIYEKNVLQNI